MEGKYKIPKVIGDFNIGTEYQVMYLDGTWGKPILVYKLCWSVRMDLKELIKNDRIRIIDNGK